MAQPIEPYPAGRPDSQIPRTADGIGAALTPARRTEFYRELGQAPVERVEAVLRRWWSEAMLDNDPQGQRIIAAALDGTLPLSTMEDIAARRRELGLPLE